MRFTNPHDALRYHTTGAIERGEREPIIAKEPRYLFLGEAIRLAAYAAICEEDAGQQWEREAVERMNYDLRRSYTSDFLGDC